MYYPASDIIASRMVNLADEIRKIDEFLYDRRGGEFEAKDASDFLRIRLYDVKRILNAYKEQGVVSQRTIWRCPKHAEEIKVVGDGLLYCPTCDRTYPIGEYRSITLYSVVALPEQISAPAAVKHVIQSEESAETASPSTEENSSTNVPSSRRSRSTIGCFRGFAVGFTALVLIGVMVLLFQGCVSPLPLASATTTPGSVAATIQNQNTERIAAERSSPLMINCGGSGDVKRTISRGRETTVVIELSAAVQLEASIAQTVKASIETQLRVEEGETISSTDSVEVNVAPRTSVQYEVQWYETWQTGDIVMDALRLTIPYRVRVGYDADIIDSQDRPCPTTPTVQPSETLTETPSATSTPTPSETASLTATNTPTSPSTGTHTPVPPTATETASATITVAPSPTATSTHAPSWTPAPTSTGTSLTPEWMLPVPTASGTEVQNPSWMLPTNTLPAGSGQYPCAGTITGSGTGTLLIIYARPISSTSPRASILSGTRVFVIDDAFVSGRRWYQIQYGDDFRTGWLWDTYLSLSDECP